MPLSRAETAQLLSGVPLLSHCSKRELAAIARLAHELDLPEGHTRSRLLAISAHNFQPLLKRSPGIQLKLLEALAERLPGAG